MKKVIFICLPFIALIVIFLGSNITFKSLLENIANLDFKVPNFLEMQQVLNTIKTLLDFSDSTWYEIPLQIFLTLTQVGRLIGSALHFVVLFFYDFIYNVIQVLGLFGRLILN